MNGKTHVCATEEQLQSNKERDFFAEGTRRLIDSDFHREHSGATSDDIDDTAHRETWGLISHIR